MSFYELFSGILRSVEEVGRVNTTRVLESKDRVLHSIRERQTEVLRGSGNTVSSQLLNFPRRQREIGVGEGVGATIGAGFWVTTNFRKHNGTLKGWNRNGRNGTFGFNIEANHSEYRITIFDGENVIEG